METEASDSIVDNVPKTPRRAGRPKKLPSTSTAAAESAVTPGKRGRKRKGSESVNTTINSTMNSTLNEPKTPGRKQGLLVFQIYFLKQQHKNNFSAKLVAPLLTYDLFAPSIIGDRVLSCGEGEALGHPGRTTTKKPRKVDIFEEEGLKPLQAVAGGVHSAVLTSEGEVYMCGINEKGTVPAEGVEKEGSTDEFAKVKFEEDIEKEGKVCMLSYYCFYSNIISDCNASRWSLVYRCSH